MNNVSLICSLKENLDDKYRLAEYMLPTYNEEGLLTQRIVIKYWLSTDSNSLNSLKEGTRVALKGHLDLSNEFGTVIIVEYFQAI